MSKPDQEDEKLLNTKLDEINRRLMGEPTREDLSAMQLHLDTIQKWDYIKRYMRENNPTHDHDTNEHHDHTFE